MGKKSSSPPDTKGAARIEGEFSRDTARDVTYADRPDQYNPLGSLTWTQEVTRDPGTGKNVTKWVQRQRLNSQPQRIFNREMATTERTGQMRYGAMARAQQDLAQGADFDQFGDPIQLGYGGQGSGGQAAPGQVEHQGMPMPGGQAFGPGGQVFGEGQGGDSPMTPMGLRQRAEDAAYQRDTMRLDPRFQQREEQIELQMRNQGLRPGDQAYDAAMSTFGNERNDAYERARLGSVGEGRAESQQMWDQSLQGNELANALRQQRIDEYVQRRGFNLSEAERLGEGTSLSDLSDMATGGG